MNGNRVNGIINSGPTKEGNGKETAHRTNQSDDHRLSSRKKCTTPGNADHASEKSHHKVLDVNLLVVEKVAEKDGRHAAYS